MNYKPRLDYVLVRISRISVIQGVHVPDTSAESLVFHVVEVGPDVEGLKTGDRVILVAKQGQGDYYPLPREKDLIIIKQVYVAAVVPE